MITILKENDIDIVGFQPDCINALNVETIKGSILQLFEAQHNKIIINLSGITYIDSTGFAMFLQLRRAARANYSTLKLCCLTKPIQVLFNMLNIDSFFEIHADVEECILSFQG